MIFKLTLEAVRRVLYRPKLDAFLLIRRKATTDNLNLKEVVAEKIVTEREKVAKFLKSHGKVVVQDIDIETIYGGMNSLKALICETSVLDPDEGSRFRGYFIHECKELLPKAKGGEEPLPEGIFWLLMTGDIPTQEQVASMSAELADRASLPAYVETMIHNFPPHLHPMSQFSAAITAMSCESSFTKEFKKGMKKTEYWHYVYDDAIELIAKLPVIAAKIYSVQKKKDVGTIDAHKDWSANLVHMMGFDNPQFTELMRLYMTIHCDHEGGNVSAHAVHLVGSALADPYLAFAAGMNGLAGPLHGGTAQEVLEFLDQIFKDLGEQLTDDQLRDYIRNTLKEGHRIPGFGHPMLRVTDPRYICQREFTEKHLPHDDPFVKLTSQMFKVVPGILQEVSHVTNPWPSAVANSGILFRHYGLKEMQFYLVLFGVSRSLGTMASLVWARALGMPIERPKSLSTSGYMKLANVKE